MDITSNVPWSIIFLVILAIVGNMEWLKGKFKTVSSDVWYLVSFGMCFALFAITEYLKMPWILYAFVASSLLKLGYEVIVKGIPVYLKKIFGIDVTVVTTTEHDPSGTQIKTETSTVEKG